MSYRYFAFLDLLGYRPLIKADVDNGAHLLRDKLVAAFGALGNINEADVSIKAISDSIFLTLNNDTLGFLFFAKVIRELQIAFIQNGLLLRGGLAFNQHFENGKVTYSPALVDAHRLESAEAFFPRVIVHSAVIQKLINEQKLDDVVAEKLLVKHGTSHQIHLINNENWQTLFDQISSIAIQDQKAINSDPRIYAKHWYLQEYLLHFKPKGSRAKRYLSGWS